MNKFFLSLIAVAIGTLSSFAQDDCVATLNHGTTLTTYMGEDALAQAYNAAADGDVITLSPGVFVSVDMGKAITLRGAGYKPMASNGYVSTQITGQMRIEIPSDGTATFEMEGIDFLNSVTIVSDKKLPVILSKSKFRGDVRGIGINLKATHCIFGYLYANYYESYNGYTIDRSTTLNCQSCVIGYAHSDGMHNNKIIKISATNCILKNGNELPYSALFNCILIRDNSYILAETCTAHNCISFDINYNTNTFSNIVDPTNVMIEGTGETAYTNIFKTLTNIANPSLYETFELTDAAKATYLGEDGTQVGIYGGTAPFTLESTNPQVTKFVVSSATEGSLLKVKINVE